MSAIVYRPATLADAADIHALLLAQAAEIPLLVDTLEREEALYALIRSCARSGESWVAVNGSGQIVGAALAERAQHGRHYAEHEVLDLRHVAESPALGESNVLVQLIGQLLGRVLPVVTTVSPHNRTGLANSLARLGFRAAGEDGQYRWQPGNPPPSKSQDK